MFRFTIVVAVVGCGSSPSHPMPDAAPVLDDAPPQLLPYGAGCTASDQCAGGRCVMMGGSPGTCSRACTLAVANDCKVEQAFCVPASGDFVCAGHIDTGIDDDDAIVHVGDSVTRAVTPLGDADLFLVHLDQIGTIYTTAKPVAGVDVELDMYDRNGQPVATANAGGAGAAETAITTVMTADKWVFAVVRDVGTSTGGYTLSVSATPM